MNAIESVVLYLSIADEGIYMKTERGKEKRGWMEGSPRSSSLSRPKPIESARPSRSGRRPELA